ncbi:MAG: cellulase family glycosylhydrolase [Armatimonadota bacterium]
MFRFFVVFALISLAATSANSAIPSPRICVKEGKFIEKQSSTEFNPVGFQYIRILPSGAHYVFAPSLYDPAQIDAMFDELEKYGFNIVRVFIGNVELTDGDALSPKFMANFCDFLQRARENRIYVLPVIDWLPPSKRYMDIASKDSLGLLGMQRMFLDKANIKAKERYLSDFIRAIKKHDPKLLSTVFAYELENEANMESDKAPFAPADKAFMYNGRKYDLSSAEGQQNLADDAIVYTADRLVKAIHREDPEAMVTYSVYTFAAVGRTGPGKLQIDKTPVVHFPMRPLALTRSKLSYIDIHFYAASPEGMARDLKSIEWDELKAACDKTGKPMIVGEYGTFPAVHKTVDDAAYAMGWYTKELLDLGFDGLIYWTYDCHEQVDVWDAKRSGGDIFRTIVQVYRKYRK